MLVLIMVSILGLVIADLVFYFLGFFNYVLLILGFIFNGAVGVISVFSVVPNDHLISINIYYIAYYKQYLGYFHKKGLKFM